MKLYDLDNAPNSVTPFWKDWSIGQRVVAVFVAVSIIGFLVYRLFHRDKEQKTAIADGTKKLTKAQKEKEAYEQFIKQTLGQGVANQVKEKISEITEERGGI